MCITNERAEPYWRFDLSLYKKIKRVWAHLLEHNLLSGSPCLMPFSKPNLYPYILSKSLCPGDYKSILANSEDPDEMQHHACTV